MAPDLYSKLAPESNLMRGEAQTLTLTLSLEGRGEKAREVAIGPKRAMMRGEWPMWIQALTATLFVSGFGSAPWFAASLRADCIRQTVSDTEILAREMFDLDGDGRLDAVVIYGEDQLYALIVEAVNTPECRVVLRRPLAHRQLLTGRQNVAIRAVEQVEVTGVGPPEIHIGLDVSGGGMRASSALNALYTRDGGAWQEIWRSGLCLALSEFQFRDGRPGAKDIYVDEDRVCQEFSSERVYSVWRWDGSDFTIIEEGTIKRKSIESLICGGICVGPPVAGLVLLGWVLLRRHLRERQARARSKNQTGGPAEA